MRSLLRVMAFAAALASCQSRPGAELAPTDPPPRSEAPSLVPSAAAAPSSDAALAVQRELQARRLRPALRREITSRLAFARDVVAQLTADALRVYSTKDGSLVTEASLESPRAVVGLADGALLALGGKALVRVDGKKVTALPKPVFLPGSDLFADAVQPDRIWIAQGRTPGVQPLLSSYRLAPGTESVLLPEQLLSIDAPGGGSFGVTREGVWLYFGEERIERFGPSGVKLTRLAWAASKKPFLALPTRRLDQEYLLDEEGHLTRALVTPLFRKLSESELGAAPLAACMADGARTLALIAIVGEGPRFELRLFDEKLAPAGSASLVTEAPTGRDDWLQVVTRNLELSCAPHAARVAVGGPNRVQIFDGHGQQILSIPSR
jgi:hypothetical protein